MNFTLIKTKTLVSFSQTKVYLRDETKSYYSLTNYYCSDGNVKVLPLTFTGVPAGTSTIT
jgi:hypothetical protein